jgi:hypothetical protein
LFFGCNHEERVFILGKIPIIKHRFRHSWEFHKWYGPYWH